MLVRNIAPVPNAHNRTESDDDEEEEEARCLSLVQEIMNLLLDNIQVISLIAIRVVVRS